MRSIKKKKHKGDLFIQKSKKKYKNQNIRWINSSLKISKKNFDIIKSFAPECVFHLAWNKIPIFDKKTCNENLNQSTKFLEKITKIESIKKVIVSGSCAEYFNKNGAKKENNKLDFNNHFPNSKNTLYFFAKKLCEKKGIKLAWFRIFYVYGTNQRKEALIPKIINSIKNKKKIHINNPDEIIDKINSIKNDSELYNLYIQNIEEVKYKLNYEYIVKNTFISNIDNL